MKLNFQSANMPPMQHLGLPGQQSPVQSPVTERRRSSTISPQIQNIKSIHTSKSNPNITGTMLNEYSSFNNNNYNTYNQISISQNNFDTINNGNNVNSEINFRKNASNTTLSVQTAHFALQRRSVIGRQDKRTSFQTQRLSDVGVAVGQQITAKMGLKLPASQERIVEQTRWLYLRYIFEKLRQKSLPLRDLNLTRALQARRAAALGRHNAKTSQSAPNSANVGSTDINFVPFGRKISPQIPRRDRSTRLNHNINYDELFEGATLNTRQNNINGNADMFNNNNNSNNDNDAEPNSATLSTSNSSNLLPGGRKFIMDPTINKQILSVIMSINKELHDTQPELYDDSIYELIGIDKFTSLDDLLEVQKRICQEMTRTEISWCRIVALFSLFGAMSLDCVRLGSPEHVGPILDGFLGFVERDLALWISQQGGWEAFLYKYRVRVSYFSIVSRALIITCPILVWFAITLFR